jgi:hypothetical protein
MISRRKISLLLYRELIMMSIRRVTSAWNSNFSAGGPLVSSSAMTPSLEMHRAQARNRAKPI